MLYRIQAELNDGQPQLQILDASGDCLRLAWQPGVRGEESGNLEIRHFFRDLLLITTMDELLETSHHQAESG